MGREVRISRVTSIPDALRISRIRRAPELGPKILFFSGGTALRELSRKLKQYTHNSIHLMTPFDSGGSSASLRSAFGMLSVGDIRSRLVALADESVRGNPEIYRLFSYRLPATADAVELMSSLDELISGSDPIVSEIPEPMRLIVQNYLRAFQEEMPSSFDLRGASIGNLLLAGGYLRHDENIDSVIFLFSKLLEVRGIVRPTADSHLHLAAHLEDGSTVVGQHELTGKERPAIESPIRELYLVRSLEDPGPAHTEIDEKADALIRSADVICYPMGSFYTSVLASLVPEGVGQAIAQTRCPKIYVPNLGPDPEQLGLTVSGTIGRIIDSVRVDAGERVPDREIVEFVLVDSRNGHYEIPLDLDEVKSQGLQIVDIPLARTDDARRFDAEKLCEAILSFS